VDPSGIYTLFAKSEKASAFLKLYNEANTKNMAAMEGLVKKYLN
jgi:hypothetical protein